MNPLDLLAAHPAFAALPPSALKEIDSRLREERFAQGSQVIREGERGDRLFLVTAGKAEARGQTEAGPVPVATLSEGDLFGEISLLDQGKGRTATVVALTGLTVATLDVRSFHEILASLPDAGRQLSEAAERVLIVNFLKAASPFGSLANERLRLLAGRIRRRSFKQGDLIVREGDGGDSCFLVRTGMVEVNRGEREGWEAIAKLHPGSIFGEAALLTESPRSASVRALEEAELLEIRRADLLQAVREDRQVGSQVFGLLTLRDRPRRIPDVQERALTTEEGLPVTILIHPTDGTYFRLSPHGLLVWRNLDGSRNLKDLTLLYFEEFHLFSPHTIAETVAGLVASGFAQSRATRASRLLPRSWGERAAGCARSLLEWRVMWRNADSLFCGLYRAAAPLFSGAGQVLLGAVSLAGLALFLYGLSNAPLPWIDALSLRFLLSAFAFFLVAAAFHEAGHALAVKSFGRKVLGVGAGWNWVTPIFFVDTSDMWLAPRRQRMAVHWAGPYTHLILGGACSILAAVWDPTAVRDGLRLAAAGSYLLLLTSMLPVLNLDGHHLLKEFRSKPQPARPAVTGSC